MDNQELEQKIEALLFHQAASMKIKEIATLLETDEENVQHALETLRERLDNRGVRLIWKNDEIMLATAPQASGLIEKARRAELSTELGKAAVETLAIVLYRGPISRSEIDYIRGVNSTFILRSLLIRGLVERIQNERDQRSYLYRPTFDLLGHLGITSIEELPEFDTVRKEIEVFEKELADQTNEHGESEHNTE